MAGCLLHGDCSPGDAGAVDGVDGEDVVCLCVETWDFEAGGVVDLIVAEESVFRETVANDIEIGFCCRRPGDSCVAAVFFIADDLDVCDFFWRFA